MMAYQVCSQNQGTESAQEGEEKDTLQGMSGVAALRLVARVVGYPLAYYGWSRFAWCLLFYVFGDHNPLQPPDLGADLGICAYLIVPGWLLLRLGAGLWPFSARMTR